MAHVFFFLFCCLQEEGTPESIMLPLKGGSAITCMDLTTSFCIFGDVMGGITFFILEDWKVLSTYRHAIGIKKVFADTSGARVVFFDDKVSVSGVCTRQTTPK
jgi:hypothetical protein